jgi:hypothetical protein
VRFRQIVVFGLRRNVRGAVHEENLRHTRGLAQQAGYERLPELAPGIVEPYVVPVSGEATLTYRGLPYNLIEDLLPHSAAWEQAAQVLLPSEDIASGRPITPLHRGHVGLLCTAGLLNGVFGQGEERHIARWRSVKHATEFHEEEGDTKIIRRREKWSNELRLLYVTGKAMKLTESAPKEGDCDGECPPEDGLLEYERYTEKIATRIRVRVSHYIGDEEDGHLLSVFGNDSDVGAVTAAVYEQARFRLTFPGGETQDLSLGEGAICYRGSLSIQGRKLAVRHMIALSEDLRGMKSLSRTFVLRPEPTEVWAVLVHRFGLPGLPEWAEGAVRYLKEMGRIRPVDSVGCQAAVISATSEELLEWMGEGAARGELSLPETNGTIRWPSTSLPEVLRPTMEALATVA